MPAAIDVAWVLTDRTTTIRASVADVEIELMLAVVLVVAVIFAFLRNIPATIIPSLSVPLSIVGTFAVMYLAGFSLNNLSLMALTIATGFVVDDAIVMIENIARYIEKGDKPLDAALKGAGEIGFTAIVSLTVSLIAVLIPLLFMGDVVGRLFREFAITLSVTILISAVVSLTLVPMLCAKMLKTATWPWGRGKKNQYGLSAPLPNMLVGAGSIGFWTTRCADPDCRGSHFGADRYSIHLYTQGILSGAGYRTDSGHIRSTSRAFPMPRWPIGSRHSPPSF